VVPLGLVADGYGPRGALVVLACVTVIAIVVSAALREPDGDPEPPKSSPAAAA
jgi:MFS transporter, FSR family, fosmidomycin resistance protein